MTSVFQISVSYTVKTVFQRNHFKYSITQIEIMFSSMYAFCNLTIRQSQLNTQGALFPDQLEVHLCLADLLTGFNSPYQYTFWDTLVLLNTSYRLPPFLFMLIYLQSTFYKVICNVHFIYSLYEYFISHLQWAFVMHLPDRKTTTVTR